MGPYPQTTPGKPYMIAELPAHERPRERLIEKGAQALSDAELLAILLRTGARGRSVLDIARDLLAVFHHDLEALARASVAELCKVRGIGSAKAVEVCAAFALARRMAGSVPEDRTRISAPEDVADLMREALRGRPQEEFHVLYLDTKNGVLGTDCITVGLLDRSQVHPREVFRNAVQKSCSRIVLVHNHPSGDPTPSPEDIACTRELVKAGHVVGIEVIDHVVIGRRTATRPQDFASFKSLGLL